MASRDYLKHVVSTSETVGSALGDEYYSPASNKLYKQLAVNGTSVRWVEQQQALTVQSSGTTVATGARTINFPGATISYNSLTDTISVQSSGIPGGANTNIQFNSGGAFSGSSNLTWDGSLLNVTGRIETNGSRVVDYKNTTAQWAMSGGGLVTWTGASILWNTRVICIPVENNEMGSSGHFDITCPTSGTVVYYNNANVTTTLTATAAGIPMGAWEALYYEVTEGMSSAFDQTRFRVVNYQNTTWRPSTGWLLVAAVNGDGNNVGHIKWLPGQVNLPTTGSTVTYNTGTGVASWASATGTVTSVSVASANGFAGTVATASSTPAITISTSITGVLKGNGTAISAATAGTDYLAPPTGTAILKANSGGALANAVAGTDFLAPAGTFNLGTTSITFNRASATQSLTGINIDGSAGTFTSTSQNSQFNSIGVGVAAVANAGQLTLSNGALATTLNTISNPHISIRSTQSNSSFLDISAVRDSAGTDWTTAGTRIQMKIDSTFQAYMQFNGTNANYGIEWGSGSSATATGISARMRLDINGSLRVLSNVTSTTTTSGSVIVTGGVGVSENMYVGGYSQHVSLARTNARFASAELTPTGHYTPGETVFEIDPTWSQAELQKFFNTTGVTWLADTTSPAGYAIQMDGAINFGSRAYGSGFPMIPVETNDIYYMELWLRNDAAYVGPGHYAGGVSMDASGNVLPGNPGSYDYFVMSNTAATTTWTKYSAYITGFATAGSAAGTWPTNTKYWSPLMLANYSFTSGTRRSYLSGWRVYKVYQTGRRKFADMVTYSTAGALTAAGSTQGTALALTSDINNVTTVAAGTGVILPFWQTGHKIIIRNAGANALAVYPNSSAQINNLGTNVAFSIPAGTSIEFVNFTSTQWATLATTYA